MQPKNAEKWECREKVTVKLEFQLYYFSWKKEKKEVTQSCLTLCNPVDCSLSGSSVHGILQARILEWVAISFSRGSSQPRDGTGSPALQADALPSEPPGKPIFHGRGGYKGIFRQSLRIFTTNR